MKTLIIFLFLLFAQTESFIYQINPHILFSQTELAIDFYTKEKPAKSEKVYGVVSRKDEKYEAVLKMDNDLFHRLIILIPGKLEGEYDLTITCRGLTYSQKITL